MGLNKFFAASLGLFFLLTISLSAETVKLSWTAVGDDGSIGRATGYDLRYNTSIITEANFSNSPRFDLSIQPQLPGMEESIFVDGLMSGVRYYFAVKAFDEQNNFSPISNVVSKVPCVLGCNGIRGNVDGDVSDEISITDLVFLVQYLFGGNNEEPSCIDETDVDASGTIDIADLIYFMNFMFNDGPDPLPCP